jgi:hypothetical protein
MIGRGERGRTGSDEEDIDLHTFAFGFRHR